MLVFADAEPPRRGRGEGEEVSPRVPCDARSQGFLAAWASGFDPNLTPTGFTRPATASRACSTIACVTDW